MGSRRLGGIAAPAGLTGKLGSFWQSGGAHWHTVPRRLAQPKHGREVLT